MRDQPHDGLHFPRVNVVCENDGEGKSVSACSSAIIIMSVTVRATKLVLCAQVITVELSNKGQIGSRPFVLYMEVVPFRKLRQTWP